MVRRPDHIRKAMVYGVKNMKIISIEVFEIGNNNPMSRQMLIENRF